MPPCAACEPERTVLQTEWVCKTAPACTPRTMARWRRASTEGRPSPRTTLAASSISRNCSGARLPLSKPVEVMASRSGSREITALKFPLVPSPHPRPWNPFPISAMQAAALAKLVPFGLICPIGGGLCERVLRVLVFFMGAARSVRQTSVFHIASSLKRPDGPHKIYCSGPKILVEEYVRFFLLGRPSLRRERRGAGRNLQRHGAHLFVDQSVRSEEHTSELQSPDHLVCRLLLEKKKNQHSYTHVTITDRVIN